VGGTLHGETHQSKGKDSRKHERWWMPLTAAEDKYGWWWWPTTKLTVSTCLDTNLRLKI